MTASIETIEFILRPVNAAERPMTYCLSILADREVIWPVRGEASVSLEIQVDDLLAYLTEFWKPLMLRQVYPIATNPYPLRPSDFRRLVEQRWGGLQSESIEREDVIVSAFEEVHDLSLAFGGQYGLPHFWMMRSNEHMIIETAGRLWTPSFDVVRKSLSSIGDNICAILMEGDAKRWGAAATAWSRRDNSDGASLLAWSIGIDKNVAQALIASGELRAPKDFDDAVDDNDELRIAARMAGALPAAQIKSIIRIARNFKPHQAEKLKQLAEEYMTHVASDFAQRAPFKQGEAAALFVRQRLQLSSDGRVNIASIAEDLGIEVRIDATDPPTFDGLAIWGGSFGPGVFLNQSSSRTNDNYFGPIGEEPSIRVTLAHELCHLLLDGGHALSAVEVLNARMPGGVETRAKSFAGELLLPTQVAARAWNRANRPRDYDPIKKLVGELSDDFGISWSVAAWKLEHGANAYNVDLGKVLDMVAPYR